MKIYLVNVLAVRCVVVEREPGFTFPSSDVECLLFSRAVVRAASVLVLPGPVESCSGVFEVGWSQRDVVCVVVETDRVQSACRDVIGFVFVLSAAVVWSRIRVDLFAAISERATLNWRVPVVVSHFAEVERAI